MLYKILSTFVSRSTYDVTYDYPTSTAGPHGCQKLLNTAINLLISQFSLVNHPG